MTDLIVLPGLDGTATLHSDFVSSVGEAFDAIDIVAYPRDKRLDYAELERIARAALPDSKPFILLGESFSGPIALSIAASPPANLIGLVLSTTFARSPVPLLSPLAFLARAMPVRSVPGTLLSWLLLSRWARPPLETALRDALMLVDPDVIRFRAATAMRARLPDSQLSAIAMPVLYLRATRDRLLSPTAGKHLASLLPDCTMTEIVGPHLLLQAVPADCALAVSAFARRLLPAHAEHGTDTT